MPEQLPRLSEALLASSTFEKVLDSVDMLVVEKMGRLQEALVALVALERTLCWVFVSAAVSHKSVLLLKTHLALFTLERSFFGVGALVLPEVRRPFKGLSTRRATERPFPCGLALVVQELRRFLEVEFTQVTLEQVFARVGIHVAHKVLPMLEGLIADRAFVRAVSTMSALVMRQMRRLAKALFTCVAFVRFLARVHSLMPRELR